MQGAGRESIQDSGREAFCEYAADAYKLQERDRAVYTN